MPQNTEVEIMQEMIESWNDLKEVLSWWKERKRAPRLTHNADQVTQRQTYHVQKQYIEAIRRASDLERISISEIVNRAFRQYFNREHHD